MHVAGCAPLDVGYSSILTREILQRIVSHLSVVTSEAQPQDGFEYVEADCETPGNTQPLYLVNAKHNINTKSQLTRTRCYGALNHVYGDFDMAPALLRPKDGIDPMVNAVSPYTNQRPILTQHKVDVAMSVAFQMFHQSTLEAKRDVVSYQCAVAGDPDDMYVAGIPRGTSAGYPYVMRGDSKKKTFFGDKDEYDFSSPASKLVEAEVARIISDAKLGVRNLHVFVDFLKDELRASAKVKSGATRLISGAPMAYVIAFRQYFLRFMASAMRVHCRAGPCVGVNPHGFGWKLIVDQIKSRGGKCVAGDYKAFDACGHPQLFLALIDQINLWYNDSDENQLIRRVLWYELFNSRHLAAFGKFAGSLIYQWNSSLPSGHPFTSFANSFCNVALLVLAFWDATGGYEEFWKHVSPFVYGDDNLLAVSDAALKSYNQNTLPSLIAPYGFTYTTEDKTTDAVPDYRSINDVSFLKRTFRYCPELEEWVGALDCKSLLKSVYYVRNHKHADEIELQAFNNFAAELSLHGDDDFDNIMHDLYGQLREYRARAKLPTPVLPFSYMACLARSHEVLIGM
jgi:hypothetical protein